MAEYTDAAKAALDPDNIRQVFRGTIELTFSGGNPIYRVGGKKFSTLKEAVNYKNTVGISVVESITPTKTLIDYATTSAGVPSGDQIHEGMINYAKRTGMTIHLHHIKAEDMDASNLEKILENFTDPKTGELQGYLNVGKSATFEQWEDSKGRLLTLSEIRAQQEKYGTVEKIFDDKVGNIAKRHKKDTRTAELTKTFDRKLTVGVYDPAAFLRESGLSGMDDITKQMAKMSQDGMSLLNPEIIDEIRKGKLSQRADYIQVRGKLPKGSQEYINLTSEIKKLTNKINELKGISVNGGLYNIRAEIFDVAASSHYSGDLKDSIEHLDGQLKGNVIVMPNRRNKDGQTMWQSAQQARGYSPDQRIDILTTYESIAQNKGRAPGSKVNESDILLDARKIIKDSWLDTQTFTAHPDLFDVRRMQRATLDAFQKQARELVDTGQLPQGMISSFREAVSKNTNLVGKTSASTLQAKAILDFVDAGGNLNDNPKLMEMALGSMSEFYSDGKRPGRARFLVPNMVRHEVADWGTMKDAVTGTPNLPAITDLPEGSITLDKRLGFAMNNKDIPKYYEAFGGFDLDDRLLAHLRYDTDTDEFFAVMTRQPTTHGEIATLKFSEFDELAQQALIAHDESYNFLDQIRAIDNGLENRINYYDLQVASRVANVDAGTASQVAYAQAYNRREEDKMAQIIEKHEEKIRNQSTALKSANKRIESGNYILGDEFDEIENYRGLQAHMDELLRERERFLTMPELDSLLDDRYMDPDEIQLSGNAKARQIIEEGEALKAQVRQSFTGYAEPKITELKAAHSVKLREVIEKVSGDWRRTVESRSRAQKYMPDLYELVERNADGNVVHKPLTLKAEKAFEPFELKTSYKPVTSEILTEAFETMVTGDNELGKYSNTKMIMDMMLHDNEDRMDEITRILNKHAGHKRGFFSIPELEEVIDTNIQNVGIEAVNDKAYSAALQIRLGEAAAILDKEGGPTLRLDRELFHDRTMSEGRSVIREAYEKELAGGPGRFEDHLVGSGAYSDLVDAQKSTKQTMDSFISSLTSKVQYNDFYSTHTFSREALQDAEFLARAYRRSQKANEGVGPSLKAISESFQDYGDDIITGGLGRDEYSKKMARGLVGDDMLAAIRLVSERRGTTESVYEAIGALQQLHNDKPRSSTARAARSILNARGESGSMLDILNRTNAHFGVGSGAPKDLDIAGLPTAPSHILETEAAVYGEKRLASSTIATKASQGLLSIGEGIARLKEVPGVKKAAGIGLATIIGSFMYQHRKDHTPEDMSGPPLLPGGSAYEKLPVQSLPTLKSGYEQFSQGDTYNIYATGSFDAKEFNESVSSLMGAPPSSMSVYKTRNPKHQGSMDAYVERAF